MAKEESLIKVRVRGNFCVSVSVKNECCSIISNIKETFLIANCGRGFGTQRKESLFFNEDTLSEKYFCVELICCLMMKVTIENPLNPFLFLSSS